MNKQRILEIADLIEAGHDKLGFDMNVYGAKTDCGTVACIAGWAVARYGVTGRAGKIDHRRPRREDECYFEPGGSTKALARKFLGLSCDEANVLFVPSRYEDGYSTSEITANHAVATLRHLAETGEVDWRATAHSR